MPRCSKCNGEGRVADSADQEPWSAWATLPRGSDLAVRFGLVKPIPCPKCGGTGQISKLDPQLNQDIADLALLTPEARAAMVAQIRGRRSPAPEPKPVPDRPRKIRPLEES